MNEEKLRQYLAKREGEPQWCVFNNFHGHFPGGYKRKGWADMVYRYLLGQENMKPGDLTSIRKLLKLWVTIDAKLWEMGLKLNDVRKWVHYGKLESEHREVMVEMYVHLIKQGYRRERFTG